MIRRTPLIPVDWKLNMSTGVPRDGHLRMLVINPGSAATNSRSPIRMPVAILQPQMGAQALPAETSSGQNSLRCSGNLIPRHQIDTTRNGSWVSAEKNSLRTLSTSRIGTTIAKRKQPEPRSAPPGIGGRILGRPIETVRTVRSMIDGRVRRSTVRRMRFCIAEIGSGQTANPTLHKWNWQNWFFCLWARPDAIHLK